MKSTVTYIYEQHGNCHDLSYVKQNLHRDDSSFLCCSCCLKPCLFYGRVVVSLTHSPFPFSILFCLVFGVLYISNCISWIFRFSKPLSTHFRLMSLFIPFLLFIIWSRLFSTSVYLFLPNFFFITVNWCYTISICFQHLE